MTGATVSVTAITPALSMRPRQPRDGTVVTPQQGRVVVDQYRDLRCAAQVTRIYCATGTKFSERPMMWRITSLEPARIRCTRVSRHSRVISYSFM